MKQIEFADIARDIFSALDPQGKDYKKSILIQADIMATAG